MTKNSHFTLRRRQFLQMSALGATLGATALTTPHIIRTARADDEIFIYSWETYHEDEWLEEWTKASGINVKIVRAGTVDEMYAMMRAGSIQPDILWFDAGSIKRYADAGLIAPIDPARISNLGLISKGFRWQELNSYQDKIWGIPYNWGTQPLIYNEEFVDRPDSWASLWDKTYEGKVALFDDGYITFPMIAMYAGAKDPHHLTEREFDQCREALRELRSQVKILTRGWNDQEMILASDDAVIGYCQNVSIAFNLQNQGKNITYTFPKEGTPTWFDNAYITPRGNRDAVYRFIDDNLSPAWQARFIQFSGNNGILGADDARKAGLSDDLLRKTNILDQEEPDFWPKISPFVAPENVDRRIEIWNDFKAGTL